MNMNTNITTAIIDIDGTILQGQSQKYFISFMYKKGSVNLFQYFVILSWFLLYKVKILKNPSKILSYALRIFRNMSIEELSKYVHEFIDTDIVPHIYSHSKQLIKFLENKDIRVIFLSSTVRPIAEGIAEIFNIKEVISTELEFVNFKFTGNLSALQVYGEQKVSILKRFLDSQGISLAQTLILADHFSDISLLEVAGYPIVANPNKEMLIWAQHKKVPVLYLNNNESVQYIESYIESK
jgi:HAD superfamily hydrolase (TIGR01490 family)